MTSFHQTDLFSHAQADEQPPTPADAGAVPAPVFSDPKGANSVVEEPQPEPRRAHRTAGRRRRR